MMKKQNLFKRLLPFRSFFLLCTILVNCSGILDDPVSPPSGFVDSIKLSEEAETGIHKGLRGLRYFEEYHRMQYPFHYRMLDSLQLELHKLNLNISSEILTGHGFIMTEKLFAKQLASEWQTASSGISMIPTSFSAYQDGDSVYADSVDSFYVVIREIAERRKVAPVDSGLDSIFYLDSLVHHIRSKLYLSGGITVYEEEADADGDDYLGPVDSTEIKSVIRRYYLSGDTIYSAEITADYGMPDSTVCRWREYNEYTVCDDTLKKKKITNFNGMYIDLTGGEILRDETWSYTEDTLCHTVIVRQAAASNTLHASDRDGYISFQQWRTTQEDSVYTIWADKDGNGYIYNPATAGIDSVVDTTRTYRANNYLKIERTGFVFNDTANTLSERVDFYSVYDTSNIAEKVVRLILGIAGDTVIAVQRTDYTTELLTVDSVYGFVNQEEITYRVITSNDGAEQLVDSVCRVFYYEDASNHVESVRQIIIPEAPIAPSDWDVKKGKYSRMIDYRDHDYASIRTLEDVVRFNLLDSLSGSDTVCAWDRTLVFSQNKVLKEFTIFGSGNGVYTETRDDKLRETMSLDIVTGAVGDTVWDVSNPYDSLLITLEGTVDTVGRKADWISTRNDETVNLVYENGQLDIGGDRSVLEADITLESAGDSLVWNTVVEDYLFHYAYVKKRDERILFSLRGISLPDSVLKIRGDTIEIYQNGKGKGLISRAVGEGSLDDPADSKIDYDVHINLRRTSSISESLAVFD